MHGTMRLLPVLVGACGGAQDPPPQPQQLQCTIDGAQEMRVMRDCTSELSYQERDLSARVEAFGVEVGGAANVNYRPVQDSLMMLLEQQRAMCRDWNACVLARPEYVQRSEWLTSQFSTLTQILDAAGQATDPASRERILAQVLEWSQRARETAMQERLETARIDVQAQEVAAQEQANDIEAQRTGIAAASAAAETSQAQSQDRIATAAEEQARVMAEAAAAQRRALEAQQQQMASGSAQANVALQLQIQTQERDAADMRVFLDILTKVRAGSEGADEGRSPRACGDRGLRAKIHEVALSGNAIASQCQNLEGKVNDLCGRFEGWSRPNDVGRRMLGTFFQHLTQIETWMNDEMRCSRMTDAAERRRCENSYGEGRAEKEGADREGLRHVAELRRELAGVEDGRRPFPCFSQTWTRLAALQFPPSMAKNWVPTLAQQAERVCSVMGVDRGHLGDSTRSLVQALDQSESMTRQRLRQTEENVVRFRAMVRP
jgi:hypothetical protein